MSRDLGLHVSSKLSGEWSASNITTLLSEPVLEHLLSRWESLDPLVRARLLLAPLFLRKKDLRELQPDLHRLAEAGCGDRDEWVRVLGRAVGPYDGRLHLDAVLKDIKLVGKTLHELQQLLDTADPTLFRPLEDLYLNPGVRENLAGPGPSGAAHQHFRVRKASEAPSARQPGTTTTAAQRSVVGAAAAQIAGGSSHPATRLARPASAGPKADLFLPSKSQTQRLGSGLTGSSMVEGFAASIDSRKASKASNPGAAAKTPQGPLFVGSSAGGGRGQGPGGAGAGSKPKRPAILDPQEVKRMNEAAQRERQRLAEEAAAVKEAEARQRAEARAKEKAERQELKRKRSGFAAGSGEHASNKTPRTTTDSEAPLPQSAPQLEGAHDVGQQQLQEPAGEGQGGGLQQAQHAAERQQQQDAEVPSLDGMQVEQV